MSATYICQMRDGRYRTVEAVSWKDAKRYYGCEAVRIRRAPDDCDFALAGQNELHFAFVSGRRKVQIPSGEPIEWKDGVPVFRVAPTGRFLYAVRNSDGTRTVGCHLLFRCPSCKQVNVHGGLFQKPGGGDGHRCAHCNCWNEGGYFIREC